MTFVRPLVIFYTVVMSVVVHTVYSYTYSLHMGQVTVVQCVVHLYSLLSHFILLRSVRIKQNIYNTIHPILLNVAKNSSGKKLYAQVPVGLTLLKGFVRNKKV